MSYGGLPRPRVWRPEQRNEAPRSMPGLYRPFSWQTEQSYVPNINDWEWTSNPTTHQVGPSSSHGGGDYASYGGLVIIQERRGPGPFILPSFRPMFNDHIATSYPRLLMQPTDHMATSYPRLIMPTDESARRYNRQLSQEGSVPRQEDQTRMNREEQKEMLSKLKKEVYYPKESVKSLATRLSSFYRNDSNANLNDKVEEDDGKRSCVVCLEDFKPYETVMTTPCSHMFHEDCIIPWMKSNGKCPVCRMVIYKKRNNHFPTRGNNRTRESDQSVQIDPFELIALVRHMEASIGWG